MLTVLDDMIAHMINNKELNPIVTKLFIRYRKGNISIAFIIKSYFKVPKRSQTEQYTFFYYENSK